MKTGAKVFLGFLGGAVIGGTAGAFVTKVVLDKRHNAEIAELREAFRKGRKQKAAVEKVAELGSESVTEALPKDDQPDILPGGIKKRTIAEEDKVPYSKFYDENNEVEEGKVPEFNPDTSNLTATTRDDRISNISIISLDEYYSDRQNFKADLTFYKNSRVLVVDATDEVIDEGDWPTTVGNDFENNFGYEDEEPDCVFVRNENTDTDYCITIEEDIENDPYYSEVAHDLEEGE